MASSWVSTAVKAINTGFDSVGLAAVKASSMGFDDVGLQ